LEDIDEDQNDNDVFDFDMNEIKIKYNDDSSDFGSANDETCT